MNVAAYKTGHDELAASIDDTRILGGNVSHLKDTISLNKQIPRFMKGSITGHAIDKFRAFN